MRAVKKRKKAKEKQIFIFSEWDTETCYFKQIKVKNLKVLWNMAQISWNNLEKIKWKKESLYNKIKDKINFTKEDIKTTKSLIYYFLDIDWFNRDSYSQKEINFIKKNFEDGNFKVFFSNKDFELWILLHLSDYEKEDWKYIEKIKKITKKGYKKWSCNIDFFKDLVENNLQDAIKRWKKLEIYQKKSQLRSKLKLMNPYTEVYKIFEELEI